MSLPLLILAVFWPIYFMFVTTYTFGRVDFSPADRSERFQIFFWYSRWGCSQIDACKFITLPTTWLDGRRQKTSDKLAKGSQSSPHRTGNSNIDVNQEGSISSKKWLNEYLHMDLQLIIYNIISIIIISNYECFFNNCNFLCQSN